MGGSELDLLRGSYVQRLQLVQLVTLARKTKPESHLPVEGALTTTVQLANMRS